MISLVEGSICRSSPITPALSLRVYRAEDRSIRATGGRTWWAHLKFTPINIKLTILPKKIEKNPDIL